MTQRDSTPGTALRNELDSLAMMTFWTLEEVLAQLEYDASKATGGAVGLRFGPRRDGAVYFSRVGTQLTRLRKAMAGWRAGSPPAAFDLAEELREGVFAIEELQVALGEVYLPYPISHQLLRRMLLQLG